MDIIKKITNLLLSFPLCTSVGIAVVVCLMSLCSPDCAAILFIVGAVAFLSVILSRKAYLSSQDVKLRLIVFVVLFVSGCCIYLQISVDDITTRDNIFLKGCSSINRVCATFFPSRGGFERIGTVENNNSTSDSTDIAANKVENSTSNLTRIATNKVDDSTSNDSKNSNSESKVSDDSMRKLYYAWHLCVVCFVTMLVFSMFLGLYCIGYAQRWWDFRIVRPIDWYRRKCGLAWTFWGYSEAARMLAKSVTENGHKVIFQMAKDSFEGEDLTKNMVLNLYRHQKCNIVFLSGLPDETHNEFLEDEKIYLKKIDVYSDHHFILGEETRFNVRLAKAIVDARKANGFTDDVNVYVRVENSAEEDLLCEWLDANLGKEKNIFVHIVRETGLLADKYIDEYPLLGGKYPLITSDFNTGIARIGEGFDKVKILMIGFGSRGQALMNVMIENGQFIGAGKEKPVLPFSADIVAKDVSCYQAYKNKCGESWSVYHLDAPYGALDVNSPEFDAKILGDIEKLNSYGRIVICTGDDDLNISVAIRICKRMRTEGLTMKPGRLFVQIKSEEVYNRLVCGEGKNIPSFENVEFFGMWNKLFTYENVVEREKNNECARWLNWYYRFQNKYEKYKQERSWNSPKDSLGASVDGEVILSEVEQWRETAWFEKSSTLASCRGQRNLLALLGFEAVDESDLRSEENDVFRESVNISTNSIIDLMARNEHERWNAFMRTHGVLSWDLAFPKMEDVKKISNKNIKANAREQIGRHAAIVPFDELPKVDSTIAKFNNPSLNVGEENYTGRGREGCAGFENSLQWNDEKFFRWIPELMRLCGKKIVKMQSYKEGEMK